MWETYLSLLTIKNQERLTGGNLRLISEHINTLFEDRRECENIMDDPEKTEKDKRFAKYIISSRKKADITQAICCLRS